MLARIVNCCGFVCAFVSLAAADAASAADPIRYCRFRAGDKVAYGLVEGDRVRELTGEFAAWTKTETTHSLRDVELLVPSEPTQILALAGNYESHLGNEDTITTTITTVVTVKTDRKTGETKTNTTTTEETRRSGDVPEKFRIPQPFFKSPSGLVPHGGQIRVPHDSQVVHYEAELVIVIGKTATNVPKDQALDYVLGVTAGNDVSERVWQKADVQWWRAKGSDTFAPCGPFIVAGVNYDDLLLELRLNGETKQKERTSHMIQDVPSIVSFISEHVTLHPGDLIYTGTSGTTTPIKPGDVVEVELEEVGVLRNEVVAE
ncbi:MAG: fumarylacetoacetate hydrolase family protein [Planctomycetaceae bacterium]|nr:fumarylacetoacetate hydrolase family protein [Planctomycetaceae bacterium]